MNLHNQFSIPYKGIGLGKNEYNYHLDKAFFTDYDTSNVKDGTFDVDLIVDKKNDHCILTFDIKGTTSAECDRCLSEIKLALSGHYEVIIKFQDDTFNEENEEVIFMSPGTATLLVGDLIYEYINLCLPFTKTCDDDPTRSCDPEILDRLGIFEEEEEEQENNNDKGIWDSLKNLNLDS